MTWVPTRIVSWLLTRCDCLSELRSRKLYPCVAHVATHVHDKSPGGVTLLMSAQSSLDIVQRPPKTCRLVLLTSSVRTAGQELSKTLNCIIKRTVQWPDYKLSFLIDMENDIKHAPCSVSDV